MTDLAKLRQIAEEAPAGAWGNEDYWRIILQLLESKDPGIAKCAQHIATFRPSTVLLMITALEAAERWGQVRCRQYEDELMRALAALKAAGDA